MHVGITGGIGTGKTTVCHIFETLGIPVLYADAVSKSLTSHPEVIEAITNQFGTEMYVNNILQNKLLAATIFKHDSNIKLLNSILHPRVQAIYKAWQITNQNAPYTLYEAAILLESGSKNIVEKIIGVTAPLPLRIQRVVARNGITEAEVMERINMQMPEAEKLKCYDFTINNDGTALLIPQVLDIHNTIINLLKIKNNG
jgi:dephospho-CoA kinase